jgi:hypothetical protein
MKEVKLEVTKKMGMVMKAAEVEIELGVMVEVEEEET